MNDSQKTLIRYRMDRSKEAFSAARLMYEKGHYNDAVNRLYYSCFYAVIGLLATEGMHPSKHTAARALLNKNWIKTGKLSKEIGKLIDVLDDVREFSKRQSFVIEERGYMPHIDDGVLLNMALLWELVPSWQKEPKKAWEALERGDYDWPYQAMDHWPERVKEKCKTSKSYAIAQGIE